MEKKPPKIALGHVHLKVRDLERATRFYSEILGLKVTQAIGDHFVFLSAGNTHHEIALQLAPASASEVSPNSLGLYHVAFEVFSIEELSSLLEKLRLEGFTSQIVDHGISIAAYLSDPDGNGVEVFVDRRSHPGGSTSWDGQSYLVTDLRVL